MQHDNDLGEKVVGIIGLFLIGLVMIPVGIMAVLVWQAMNV